MSVGTAQHNNCNFNAKQTILHLLFTKLIKLFDCMKLYERLNYFTSSSFAQGQGTLTESQSPGRTSDHFHTTQAMEPHHRTGGHH